MIVVLLAGVALAEEEDKWNPKIPDCTRNSGIVKCQEGSSWKAGNTCTDHCHKELMDCIPKQSCGCYCDNDLRKVEGKCVHKEQCPEL